MNRVLQRNKRVEAYATFNAAGTATASVNITNGPSWEVKQISVSTTSTLLTQAASYIGTSSAGVFISNTLLGNADTDSMPNVTVRTGESLCVIWSGGTVGAQAKMTIVYDEVGY